jgi:hemoglobin-like flavoprotein
MKPNSSNPSVNAVNAGDEISEEAHFSQIPEGVPENQVSDGESTTGASGLSRVRDSVFLSYSHEDTDADWYVDVVQYLRQLSVGDELQLWDDTKINPGEDWHAAIERELRRAKAAVFLVTPTFLTSEFITGEEVPKLLHRQEMEGLVVHALIAKPCDWQDHLIADFLRSRQLSHSPDRTLEEMDGPERRRGLNELVKQIRNDIGIYRQRNRHSRRTANIGMLESLLGITIEKEVAGGDSSIIYRALKGQQEIAVKAMVSRPITDTGQEELHQEFEKCRGLLSPVFVRMFDLKFHRGYCVTTADWMPGLRLSRWLVASQLNPGARQRLLQKSTGILLMLAEALGEGHSKGLRFLNVNPEKIRLFEDSPRLYPIDFSSYVANSLHSSGVFSFPVNTLDYLAPEYIHMPAERADPLEEAKKTADSYALRCLADQYALGMVALAMLEGSAPVQVKSLADVKRLIKFQSDPRGYTEDETGSLPSRQWCRELPGLARIVWRMIEPDPADRWRNMNEVSDQLRALQIGESDAPAHGSSAKEVYVNYIMGNDHFYKRVYDNLFEGSPKIRAQFSHVEMSRQRLMLDAALERVLNFRSNQNEPTTLSSIARSHKNMGLTSDDFELFGRSFIEALAAEAPISRSDVDSWEAVMWPAIDYLKRMTEYGSH